MNVLLISPSSPFLIDAKVFPPLGLLYLGTALESAGHKVKVIDLAFGHDRLKGHNPDLVGVMALTAHYPGLRDLIAECRSLYAGVPVVVGGPHFSTCPADGAKVGADATCVGDGEEQILLMAADAAKGELKPLYQSPKAIVNVDAHPIPARHLVNIHEYHYKVDGVVATSAITQRGCPYECTFCCITGDSIIQTDRGFITLETLVQEGASRVATIAGDGPVGTAAFMGIKSTIELNLKSGEKIRCTPDHRLLAFSNGKVTWVQAGNLTTKDWVAVKYGDQLWPSAYVQLNTDLKMKSCGRPARYCRLPSMLDEDLAWLVGHILGDGHLPEKRPEVQFAATRDMIPTISEHSERIFGVRVLEYPKQNSDKCWKLVIPNARARKFLEESVGILPGRKRSTQIPPTILRSPKSVVTAFLRGLADADGYIDEDNALQIPAKHESLIRQLAVVARGLGKVVTVRPRNQIVQGKLHYNWHISIRDPKRLKLPAVASYRGITYSWMRRSSLEKTQPRHPLLIPGVDWIPVASLKDTPPAPVYDIEVPGQENFAANSIIVHNCHWEGYRSIRLRSITNIVEEVRQLKQMGFGAVMFYDDEFNINRKRTLEVAEALKGEHIRWRCFIKANLFDKEQARAFAEAGCWETCTGVESGSDSILKGILKKATVADNTRARQLCREHGIRFKAFTMVGHPGETEETAEATRQWLLTNRPDEFDISVYTPYLGTPVVDRPEKFDIKFNLNYNKQDFFYKGKPGEYPANASTSSLSAERIVQLRDSISAEVRDALGLPPLVIPNLPTARTPDTQGEC